MITRVFSDGTNRTYEYCLSHWRQWLKKSRPKIRRKLHNNELESAVLDFIAYSRETKKSCATLHQHISALGSIYNISYIRTTSVKDALKQYAYDFGKPAKKATAIGLDQLMAMVEVTDSLRDRALLTVGWSGALRASEIVEIRRKDLEQTNEGFILIISRSKTDQFGKGKKIPLPYFHVARSKICPARNLEQYLIHQSDLFIIEKNDYLIFPISARHVSRIISTAARKAGLPARYSSHSLRRGLATTAAEYGIDDRVIMRHGRWRSREMVDEYVDEGTLWSRTALDFLR